METSIEEKNVQEPQASNPPVKTEGVPSPEERYHQAEARISILEKELRGTQSARDKSENALKQNQDLRNLIADIKTEMEMTRAYLSEASVARQTDGEEPDPKKPGIDAKIRDIEDRNRKAQIVTYAQEVSDIFAEVGLDPNSAEEADIVKAWFGYGTPEMAKKGVQAAIKVADKIKAQRAKEVAPVVEKKDETPRETEEQMKARIEKEIMEKYKLLKPESTVTSSNANDDEFWASYGRGESNDHKRAAALQKKMYQGG